ncbi:MAG: GrpB family protein [Armatimonadota bacterium]
MTELAKHPQLRMIGRLLIDNPTGYISLLKGCFDDFHQIRQDGEISRVMLYTSEDPVHGQLMYFGMQVSQTDDIPDGMVVWDIRDGVFEAWEQIGGRKSAIFQSDIEYRWVDDSTPGSPCLEFDTLCPASWSMADHPHKRRFRIDTNCYIGAPVDDEIHLVDYDPEWQARYSEMEQRLERLLGNDIAMRIEHYGSTSIPGMPAKPVIDILVEIPSFEEARRIAIPAFNSPEIEYWFSDHMRFYVRNRETGMREYHLHMAPAGHAIWDGLAFRDYLRAHAEDAHRYAELKYRLVDEFGSDRLAYTDAKGAFVMEIGEKAR